MGAKRGVATVKKIREGDRVAVYGVVYPAEGGSNEYANGRRGLVFAVKGDWLKIIFDIPFKEKFLDSPRLVEDIHRKQCRRLVRKSKKCQSER